jgi:ribonuclease III
VHVPSASMEELQERIGIAFRDTTLLQEALTHSSFANESPQLSPRDNERLEYLGDAVLQLITAEYLYKYRPEANEGELTQTRSAMVNTNTLADLSEQLGIGEHLYLGKGIAKGGGRSLKSLLANAFESVLGAIFLDAGYDAAYHFYLDRFRRLPEPVKDENHKGRLQQMVQERYNQTPFYDSAGARSGSRREYTAVVFAGAEALGSGHGHTKQEAEQDAARNAIAKLLGAEEVADPSASGARTASRRRRRRGAGPSAAEVAIPESPVERVTPDEVAEVLAAEEPPGLQAPPEGELAEPVAEAAVGGPEPVSRPRARRTRRKPAVTTAPEPEPKTAPEPEPKTASEPGPEPAPAPRAEPEPVGDTKPRPRRRSPRRKAAETAKETASEPAPEAAPEPAPVAAAPAEPEAPRSRQFGEPLE